MIAEFRTEKSSKSSGQNITTTWASSRTHVSVNKLAHGVVCYKKICKRPPLTRLALNRSHVTQCTDFRNSSSGIHADSHQQYGLLSVAANTAQLLSTCSPQNPSPCCLVRLLIFEAATNSALNLTKILPSDTSRGVLSRSKKVPCSSNC